MAEAESVYVPAEKVRSIRTLGLGIAGFILVLDQAVKWVVTYIFQLEQRGQAGMELLPIFKLRWT